MALKPNSDAGSAGVRAVLEARASAGRFAWRRICHDRNLYRGSLHLTFWSEIRAVASSRPPPSARRS